MKMKITNIFFIFIFIFYSCVRKANSLEYALEAAGDNRSQLEAVLKHFKNEPEKLEAARFLIENMAVHYSCPNLRCRLMRVQRLCA
jgi:hypothetical protein